MGWGMPERDDGPQEDGPFEERRFNGQLYEKGCYRKVNFQEGRFHGPFVSYWDDGQLQKKGTYDMNRMCGEWFELGETVTYPACSGSD